MMTIDKNIFWRTGCFYEKEGAFTGEISNEMVHLPPK